MANPREDFEGGETLSTAIRYKSLACECVQKLWHIREPRLSRGIIAVIVWNFSTSHSIYPDTPIHLSSILSHLLSLLWKITSRDKICLTIQLVIKDFPRTHRPGGKRWNMSLSSDTILRSRNPYCVFRKHAKTGQCKTHSSKIWNMHIFLNSSLENIHRGWGFRFFRDNFPTLRSLLLVKNV